MASNLIQILVLLSLVIAIVLCRVIDNKIYNPDEFEDIKRSSVTKEPIINMESKSGYNKHHHHHKNDKNEEYEIGITQHNTRLPSVANGTIPQMENRFLGDVPCNTGFVKYSGMCLKSW